MTLAAVAQQPCRHTQSRNPCRSHRYPSAEMLHHSGHPKGHTMSARPGVPQIRISTRHDTSWQDRAACAETDPEMFFPGPHGRIHEAVRRICGGCAVRNECLTYALEHSGCLGVWGGKSETERRELRRQIGLNSA